jgi:hypothetical protein
MSHSDQIARRWRSYADPPRSGCIGRVRPFAKVKLLRQDQVALAEFGHVAKVRLLRQDQAALAGSSHFVKVKLLRQDQVASAGSGQAAPPKSGTQRKRLHQR